MEMDNPKVDRETAIEELSKGLDLITQLCSDIDDRSDVLRELCEGVMGAIESGLTSLKSIDHTAGGFEVGSTSSAAERSPGCSKGNKRPQSQDKRKRKELNLTKIITDSPFGDGYQWRKYGQKTIRNTEYPRCYYRCSYKGCHAKKQVQQKSNGDMPEYEVTFSNDEHTCNANGHSVPQIISPSTTTTGSEIISFESNPCTSPMNVALRDNLSEGLNFFAPPSPSGLFYATTDASAYDDYDLFSNLE